MCQSKKKGGNRCAVHMYGSRAMSKLTAITVNITTDDANGILRDLRNEGKAMNLSAPSPEQVRAFAEVQKRNVQNDPMITPRDKNMITKNLEEAAQEKPNGNVFHSWKNAVAEGMSRFMKKPAVKVSAILLAGTMAMSTVAACGTSTEPAPTTDPNPSISAPATESPSETPSESPTVETPTENPITTTSGVIPGEVANDGIGDYQQITLADDSFVLDYDETLITDTATLQNYTPEEITGAQNVAMYFLVEEALDSVMSCNATEANAQTWITENAPKIAPEHQEAFKQDILTPGSGVLQKNIGKDGNVWRGDCTYDNGPRISSIELGPQAIYLTEDGELVFHVKGNSTRHVTAPGTRGQEGTPVYLETTNFDAKYVVRKSDDGANWVLTGAATQWDTSTNETPVG